MELREFATEEVKISFHQAMCRVFNLAFRGWREECANDDLEKGLNELALEMVSKRINDGDFMETGDFL